MEATTPRNLSQKNVESLALSSDLMAAASPATMSLICCSSAGAAAARAGPLSAAASAITPALTRRFFI
ncbi:Uncharacterised protein [Mycobacteroides abscessus subsp. abscessus]|nr:Uncharacterised protein [Mycobacteroides abscessus subsp. abscessus]